MFSRKNGRPLDFSSQASDMIGPLIDHDPTRTMQQVYIINSTRLLCAASNVLVRNFKLTNFAYYIILVQYCIYIFNNNSNSICSHFDGHGILNLSTRATPRRAPQINCGRYSFVSKASACDKMKWCKFANFCNCKHITLAQLLLF